MKDELEDLQVEIKNMVKSEFYARERKRYVEEEERFEKICGIAIGFVCGLTFAFVVAIVIGGVR